MLAEEKIGTTLRAYQYAKRAGTVDEMGALVAFLMGPEATFITGTDILCDGGSTASYWYGDLQYLQEGWSKS